MIFSRLDCEATDLVLRHLSAPQTLFLIGAGASSRLCPNRREQAKCIFEISKSQGGCIPNEQNSEVRQNLLDSEIRQYPDIVWNTIGKDDVLNPTGDVAQMIAASRVNDYTVRSIHLACCAISDFAGVVPEYELFRLLPPSVIATTNYDGLAHRHCARFGHEVIHLHGLPPAEMLSSPFWTDLIRSFCEFGSGMNGTIGGVEQAFNLWLPCVERADILSRPVYRRLVDVCYQSRGLVVIGYGFSGMNDLQTFELFTNLLKDNPVPVLVIDLNPTEITSLLQQATGSTNVCGVTASWSALAETVYTVSADSKKALHYFSEEVARRYMDTWERQQLESEANMKRQCENCQIRRVLVDRYA